ncbi:GDSL-like Lipase/Acylhydrolase [Colletotrichum graminicola]|uniref:GDSL-like Lipase/Acylhydrolase n=1 Tax=Colletotrichum graminicola (strain M1.001 / M2 / FGSC 10212) TaxID=645133 RepID=E3QTT0_COLGM|nr:GDSL-like Lipase/Acylhydrolase [Colletotrichum graminicola M1.001]EFQ34242.1 GDSL-like Lipase/Acylhydrolase [Colletotrichum graminicola M1.001]WDK12657.1 GDSL-like Lipase/Acylhydrolase [Colletotrichum graminicola]
MKPQALLSVAGAALLPPAFVTAAPADERASAAKPPAFFLAGDSTTAAQSEGGGGWGNGFLGFLKEPAFGTNYGRNGRTTVDYVTMGYWDMVKDAVKANTANFDVYVTIQFGHNDQKPEKNISLGQYQTNLANLAGEIRALGATPVLVTPLTRRSFDSAGVVTNNLANERERTIAAAAAAGVTYVDLNLNSRKYVQAVGEAKAHSYNLVPGDNTHLNDEGSVVFGRLVADLLLRKETQLAQWFTPDEALSEEIWKAIDSSPV